jgi:hypothetical protein
MKRLILITILSFTFASFAMCQDLLIRYDFVNKKIYFFKIKKHKDVEKLVPMKNPRIGPNGQVRVEYININPFIWNQPGLDIVTVAQDSVSSFNPFAMMLPGGLSDGLGSIFSSVLTRDAAAMSPQQQLCASALSSLYDAYDEINSLKYDYKLTKQQILDQSNAKIRDVVKSCHYSTGMDTTKNDFKKTDFESLKYYFQDVCQMNIPFPNRSGSDSKTDSFLGNAGIDANNDAVLPAEALKDIEKNYFTVSQTDFSFENSFLVSDKDVVLHMDFSLSDEYMEKASKDSASAKKNAKHPGKVKDESIFIPVRGGVRVSSSVGIGFTYLGFSRKSYYLDENNVLTSVPDNRIVPVAGTFLNVYSRGLGVVNLGGSFGIFISLQETFAINYMLGITSVFGRKERVLVSAGCVLAPVDEPSKGYTVGDYYENPDFPTEVKYKPGIFFCVHYNIGKF